jgi:hypothetical protein
MSLLRKSDLISIGAKDEIRKYAKASKILVAEAKDFSERQSYDIFISHSYRDFGPESELNKMFLGLKRLLENESYTVFIDWIDRPELDRSKVTLKTAAKLKNIIENCSCLFYVPSMSSGESKWMPWEMGLMDGLTGKVAICPVVEQAESFYSGSEYLGIYPYFFKDDGDFMVSLDKYGSETITFYEWLRDGGIF